MPELPEVEHLRRTLQPLVMGVAVTGVRILRPAYLRTLPAPFRNLVGRSVRKTARHGKKLFCTFDDSQTLVAHLGMSGGMVRAKPDDPLEPHTHIVFDLASGWQLRVLDPRRFGGLWLYSSPEEAHARHVQEFLGVDALELEPKHLRRWNSSSARLKSALLSQRDVAGLGNIYIDESLWLARLHPLQIVNRISPAHRAVLTRHIRAILRRSIRLGGTTLRDYRNVAGQKGRFARHLAVYGQAGQPCRRCGTPLASLRVSGRATVFCPACQRRR